MIGNRFKKLILALLLILIIVGGFLFHSFQASKQVKSHPVTLINASIMSCGIEIYDLEPVIPIIQLLSTQDSTCSIGFFKTLSNFIYGRPTSNKSKTSLSIGLNNKYSLEHGVIGLENSEQNKIWISEYLRQQAQIEIPPKTHIYKEYPIEIHPIRGGTFCTILTIEGAIFLSNSLANIESIIDAFQASPQNLKLLNLLNFNKNEFVAATYIKENNNKWSCYALSVNGENYQILHNLEPSQKIDLNFDENHDNLGNLMQKLPAETFAVYHYTSKQVEQHYQESLDSVLTLKETEWNHAWENLLENELNRGLYAFRVQDSVVSSSLILQCPVSDDFAKELNLFIQDNKKLTRTLLREESIYAHWGVMALPSPYWLNQLTQTSRDLRVIYLKVVGQNLLISWDYQQLFNYSRLLKDQIKSTTSLPNSIALSGVENNFFIGNIEQMLLDSITDYEQPDFLSQTLLERLKSYILIREYLRSDRYLFQLISLSKNKPNKLK